MYQKERQMEDLDQICSYSVCAVGVVMDWGTCKFCQAAE